MCFSDGDMYDCSTGLVASLQRYASPPRCRNRRSSSIAVVVVGMAIDAWAWPLVLGEAVLTEPVAASDTIPTGPELSLTSDAHIAALVAANAGSSIWRVELVASMLAMVVVAVLLPACCATRVHIGTVIVSFRHCGRTRRFASGRRV